MIRNFQKSAKQDRAAITFLLAACWVLVALQASRVVVQIVPPWNNPLPHELLNALLVFTGFFWIGRRTVRDARPLSSIGLVERPGHWVEFGIGIALGWAVSIALVLPALLTGKLQTVLSLDRFHWQAGLFGLLLLVCNAFVTQLVFTGLLFRSLVRASSSTIAAVSFSVLAAGLLLLTHSGDVWQALFAGLTQSLFSLAALRTRAIWCSFGLQVGWAVTLLLVFGVSSFYWPAVLGPVQSFVAGPRVLTGSYLGPEASLWAFVVLVAALVALWRSTREFAWHYAYDPIVGAGHPMDVAPPKEHTRMEAEAVRKNEALVQILPVAAASPGDDNHL